MEIDQKNIQEEKRIRRKFQWIKDKNFYNDLQAEMKIKQEKEMESILF